FSRDWSSDVCSSDLETAIMVLPALGGVLVMEAAGSGTFLSVSPVHSLLLVGSGVATAVPLMLFGAAAHRIPLTLVGLLQFTVPEIGRASCRESVSHS